MYNEKYWGIGIMTIDEYIEEANLRFKKVKPLDLEEANAILEDCFVRCVEEVDENDEQQTLESLDRKVNFINALRTVYLNEIGVDPENFKLKCIKSNSGLANARALVDALENKVYGFVGVNGKTLKTSSYFKIAYVLAHEVNHVKCVKACAEGKDFPRATVANNGCATSLLPIQSVLAYSSNDQERECNINGYLECKKWLEKAVELGADDGKLKNEEISVQSTKFVDDFLYYSSTLLLGQMWDNAISRIFEKVMKRADGERLSGATEAITDSYIEKFLFDVAKHERYLGKDVIKEQRRICERLMQLILPIFGIGFDDYFVSLDENDLNRVMVWNLDVFRKEYGAKNDFMIKYQVQIPKSYLELPPRAFIEKITRDLLVVADRLHLDTSKMNNLLEKCSEM